MKVTIVGCFFLTVLACASVPSVAKAGPKLETVQAPPTELKVVDNRDLLLPDVSNGKPEIKVPLSKPVLLHYHDQYIPTVIDLEYQDTLMQRLGVEDPEPQVLSIWGSDFVIISAATPNGKAINGSVSYAPQNIHNLELKVVDKTFTFESNNHLYINANFTTFVLPKEAKEALMSASPDQVSLRIQVYSTNASSYEQTFVNTPIGKKTIKAWQSLSS